MTETTGAARGPAAPPIPGVSSYATGGGGVTFERRAATMYLERLLSGSTAVELPGRRVRRVAFQQAPARSVDDLLIVAARDDGCDLLELSVAVRRAPDFTKSDKDTEKLFGDLIADLPRGRADEAERRLAVCVAGPQPAAQQVAQLAALAPQHTAVGFFAWVRTPRRFRRPVVDRLTHLVNLVTANLSAAGADASASAAEAVTWQLLCHLDILMPRLEPPDETDWVDLLNRLEPWAREPTLDGAAALRDRLESLAATYAPVAADVDIAKLRRDAHEVLHCERRRRAIGWAELLRFDADARDAISATVGLESAGSVLRLPRPGPAAAVRRELTPGPAVLVTGESGVGKSALVLGELTEAADADPVTYEVVYLNLRLLPPTAAELRTALGASLDELLAEMSAPTRVLVLDGADMLVERDDLLLMHLLRAAQSAAVTPWVVCATDARAAVQTVVENVTAAVREITIGGLEDTELDEVARAFPHLRRLVNEPRAKELLRRPAVIDLFVRSGSNALPLSDADALDIVWAKLVRDNERQIRGLPDARDQVMRQLATQQLRSLEAAATSASLGPAAVNGLIHDALLRRADRWQPLPAFAHDLLRTYAVATVLLATGDPVGELLSHDAPRWALPAARLAIQVLLAAPDTPQSPCTGRLSSVQATVDLLPAAGHADRWADLPTEALLTLPNASALLADGWPALVDADASGLHRLLRVIKQRHDRGGVIDRLIAEPVVLLLLERGWPARLDDEVHAIICAWLRGLVLAGEPAGHPLRIRLRGQLTARVAAGDERLAETQRERAEQLVARTAEEVAADAEHARTLRAFSGITVGGRRRRRRWRELPRELIDDDVLTRLGLLGADIGDFGETLLRRVAEYAPHRLAEALEAAGAGQALASYSTPLLVDLVDAYYIDERDDGAVYHGLADDGVRHHGRGFIMGPLAAFYRGPFLALFRADLRQGVACLNRLLNHAARARVEMLRQPPAWGAAAQPEDHYVVELDITGDRRRYVGDGHVWLWYRGTGVGPYPCMSALQALELVCDEYLKAGVPPGPLVRLLLEGCENLAMPAVVVGMLVRHLEKAGSELDPFLAEPVVWHLEFARATHEGSGLAARVDGIVAPERRGWSLREVSAQLALRASGDRIDQVRAVGRRLVSRAAQLDGQAVDGAEMSEGLAEVRAWASSLDRDSYRFAETDEGILVELVVEPEVAERPSATSADIARVSDATRITMRYPERFDHHAPRRPVTRDDLLADLALGRSLVEDPPEGGGQLVSSAPATVAAAALEARLIDERDVPHDGLAWAARLLVELMNTYADHDMADADYAVFGRGPDRAAARALPLLALPAAATLRDHLAAGGVDADAVTRAMSWIVGHASNEARLFLVRAFDSLWNTACNTTSGTCHHVAALQVVEDTARDCLVGSWDQAQQRNRRTHIHGPVVAQLVSADDQRIDVPRLTAAIRGASAAAASDACCRADAAELLGAALAAHGRGMLGSDEAHYHSSDDAAAAARAVLDLAGTGDRTLLLTHLDGYADNPRLLSEFLHALVAAGEESTLRAAAAREIWPTVLDRVVDLLASGRFPNRGHHHETPLAAVIPTPSYESGYLHREFHGEPILWPDPRALAPQIERWLPLAAGHRESVDALAHLLHRLPAEQQALLGIPWMEQLVMASPEAIASRSYLLPEWLQRVRPHIASPAVQAAWHRMVDALTVAGEHRIAAMDD